jgi:thiol-disulfide isomerase/thioredoxin
MAIKRSHFWKCCAATLGAFALGVASFSGIANASTKHKGHAAPAYEGPPSIQKGAVPTTAFDANGRLWAVWAFGPHLYVNHSDDKGSTFSTPVKVNAEAEKISTNPESRPHIKIASNGNVYVSYAIKLKKRFSGHVKFSRSTDGGKTFSTPIIVNDNRDMIGHSFPVLGINKQDQLYIAWLDSRDRVAAKKAGKDYNGSALYYATSDDHGVSFQPNAKIADTTCQCCRLDMAMDNELPVITWRHIYGDNIRDQAIIRFTDQTTLGKAQRVSEDQWQIDACPHHGSTLAIDDNGSYHTAWFTQGSTRQGLFYASSNNQGQQFSAPLPFGDAEAQAKHPTLLTIDDTLYLAWKAFDGEQNHIRLMQSNNNGAQWQAVQTIASSSGDTDHPFLIENAGNAYLSWYTSTEGLRLIPLASKQAASIAPTPRDFISGSMAQITAQQQGAYIVNFWSIDCPPCYKEMKMWRELKLQYPSMKVVLISTDPAEYRDEVMQTTQDLGVTHFESWQFADNAQRLRFEIDKQWFGELPRTYFRDRHGNTEAVSGLVKRELVTQWLEQNISATVASAAH